MLSDGGSFVMKGYTDDETWVPLPGERGTWPYTVRDQEEHLLVIDREGIPHAQLQEGKHIITGIFSWSALPDHIKIPSNIGIVSATSNNQAIPVYRTPNRVWFSLDSLPAQTHRIQKTQENDQVLYTILSKGPEQSIQIPLSIPSDQELLDIESNSAHWYQKDKLHMQLPQGEHTVRLSMQGENKSLSESSPALTLNRLIDADTKSLVITDIWGGYREQALLLYPDNTQYLPNGNTSISITQYQSIEKPLTPLAIQQNIKKHTVRLRHAGDLRVFEQWPLESIGLWFLCALMLWKTESFQKRRLFLLSALFSAILSPIALIFCIGWIASKESLSSISGESIKIYTLAIFGIFAGLIMFSIQPSTVYTIELHQITPELYWLDNTTVFSFALMAISLFAFVAYKNIQSILLVFICIFLFPKASFAESGFPLCSVQLEGNSIIISGEIHQAQKGEWKAPGPIGSIHIDRIIVDGQDFDAFRTTSDHYVSLFLPKGISEFELHGTYNAPFGLQFPQKPARLDFFSSTHQVEGLNEDHSPQHTLFFWNTISPHTITPKPTLTMNVQVDIKQTTIQSTITHHQGSKEYPLPIWSDQETELVTQSTQQVFPSPDSHSWTETFSTPSTLSFVPSSELYNIKTYVRCTNDLLCTYKEGIWNEKNSLNPTQSITITPVSSHTKARVGTNHQPQASFSLWTPPTKASEKEYIINHNPHSMFFRLHIPYLCLSLLICFSCAFILAKHTSSPLNIMEWLWILIGASCIHPLAIPFCILSILCLHNRWIKTLCIFALGWLSYTNTSGISSWRIYERIVAVDTELVHQLIGLWLLGVFFFIHSFQLSQKTMKIGGSQAG